MHHKLVNSSEFIWGYSFYTWEEVGAHELDITDAEEGIGTWFVIQNVVKQHFIVYWQWTIQLSHINLNIQELFSKDMTDSRLYTACPFPCKVPHLVCSENIHKKLYYCKSCLFVCSSQSQYYTYMEYNVTL